MRCVTAKPRRSVNRQGELSSDANRYFSNLSEEALELILKPFPRLTAAALAASPPRFCQKLDTASISRAKMPPIDRQRVSHAGQNSAIDHEILTITVRNRLNVSCYNYCRASIRPESGKTNCRGDSLDFLG